MKVELSPKAAKYLERLNQPQKGRIMIETDLTEEEKKIIAEGRKNYKKGDYLSLDSIS